MDLTGKRVLTIDDSQTIRKFLEKNLGRRGAAVTGAQTGAEGLELLAQQPFDLVLLDLFLPDTDGLAVLAKLRETDQRSAVIMLTGVGGIRSAIAAVQQGADGYVEKQDMAGADPGEFLFAIGQALAHRASLVAGRELERVRQEFHAMLSLDLRGPASAILGAAEGLLAPGAPPIGETQRSALALVEAAARDLLSVIDGASDLVAAEGAVPPLERAPANLADLVEARVRLHEPVAALRQVALVCTADRMKAEATVDAPRLGLAVDALLELVLRSAPQGSRVAIALAVDGGNAVLRVEDEGSGVGAAPRATERLLTRGLAVAREIVTRHGGSLEERDDGSGTRLVLRVPLSPL